MTLIQRFRSAANLNVHLQMLVLDGVYRKNGNARGVGGPRFVPVAEPTPEALQVLVQAIAEPLGRSLERAGLIARDIENAYLAFDPGDETPINTLLGHTITQRVATGPREGQKVLTLARGAGFRYFGYFQLPRESLTHQLGRLLRLFGRVPGPETE